MVFIHHFRASMCTEQSQLPINLADFAQAAGRGWDWLRSVNDCANASKRIVEIGPQNRHKLTRAQEKRRHRPLGG
jgi:hypothetical protein